MALDDARRQAAVHRSAVAGGHKPLAERRRSDTPTFRDAAQSAFDSRARAGPLGARPEWSGMVWDAMGRSEAEVCVFAEVPGSVATAFFELGF